jgi:hypothetical protein
VLGLNPSRLIGLCLSPFELFVGVRPGREPSGAGTLPLGVAFRLSVMLGRDLEPKIFWGTRRVPGAGKSRHRLLPALIPMGGWCGSPAPKELRLRARKPLEKLVVHLRAVPRKPTLPGGRGVGR